MRMINSEMTFDYSEVIEKLSEPLRKKLYFLIIK